MSVSLKAPEKTQKNAVTTPRLALVGCGAVAMQFHLPVLAGHEGIQLQALVDRDLARAQSLAREYRVSQVFDDIRKLDRALIDGVILATPPAHHAPACLDLVARGFHVFVEKPIALNASDAEAMVQAAKDAGVALAVGVFRRILPAVRLLKGALEDELLGKPLSFDVADGALYGWGAATLANMKKDLAGGGVLIDMGSHTLDRLLYLLPGPVELLDYRDNSLGGVESDCRLRLKLLHRNQPVEGVVELSRTRNLHNTVRIECERGRMELRPGDRFRVWITPKNDRLRDQAIDDSRPYSLQASWIDESESSWYEPFRAEIDDWLNAIRSGSEPLLSGESVLPTARLIDECYRRVRQLDEPWVHEGLHRPLSGIHNGQAPSADTLSHIDAKSQPYKRILVTGATGFIGCRAAEILCLREGWQVRALVHKPSSAARLARLPVEMITGDLQSPTDVARALEGCDAVVHCAVGTDYGNPRNIRAVTVEGTRNLAEAARTAGVKRFVHISSMAVMGADGRPYLDENSPLISPRGYGYSNTKAAAENAVLDQAKRGLPAVILRPGCVYGPFGQTFSVRPIQAILKGQLVLEDCAEKPANTVFVDNVAEAIVRALSTPDQAIKGKAFLISDGDGMTWGNFLGFYASALGGSIREDSKPAHSQSANPRWFPLKWLKRWFGNTKDLLTSHEFKSFAKRTLRTDPYGWLPRTLMEKLPALERWARKRFASSEAPIYRRPTTTGISEVRFTPHIGPMRIDAAREFLQYRPVVSGRRAQELTLQWIRHAHLDHQDTLSS